MNILRKTLIGMVALSLLATGLWWVKPSTAAVESKIGYVDQDFIVDVYAGPQIQAVIRERDRLQNLFDAQSANLSDAEKRTLFLQFETQLQSFEDEIGIRTLMSNIDNALRDSAEAHGVDVILDIGSVVYGGIDLTGDIQRRLGFPMQ